MFYQTDMDQFDIANLPAHVDKMLKLINIERNSRIQSGNFLQKLQHTLDKILWTDKIEYIDRDHFPTINKQKIINGLHNKNALFGTYNTFFNIILPYIRIVNQQEMRPCKILEIAGGSGQLAFFIANKAKKHSLNINMTSSDIVEQYVRQASKLSSKNNACVQFKQIDALSLDHLSKGDYDIILNLHSLHHFSAGQLAKIFHGSQAIANKAFVAIDGYRGFRNLLFMGISSLLQSLLTLNSMYVHDAWLSARKLYPEILLEIIAKIACPNSRVKVWQPSIGLSALVIEPGN